MRLVCGGDSEIERGDACNCCRENKKRERGKEKRKEERERASESDRKRTRARERATTCNCAVQLWLVPFDKTDLAVKNGFDKGRISGYESISDTKASQFGVSSLSLFLIPSSRPSLSLISPFLSLSLVLQSVSRFPLGNVFYPDRLRPVGTVRFAALHASGWK